MCNSSFAFALPRHRSTITSNTRVMAGCLIDLPGWLMVRKCCPKVHKVRAQFFGAWYSAGSDLESKVAHWIIYAYSCIKQIQSLLWHWTKLSTCSINILTLFGCSVRWKACLIIHHQTHTHPGHQKVFSQTHWGPSKRQRWGSCYCLQFSGPQNPPQLSSGTPCCWDGKWEPSHGNIGLSSFASCSCYEIRDLDSDLWPRLASYPFFCPFRCVWKDPCAVNSKISPTSWNQNCNEHRGDLPSRRFSLKKQGKSLRKVRFILAEQHHEPHPARGVGALFCPLARWRVWTDYGLE